MTELMLSFLMQGCNNQLGNYFYFKCLEFNFYDSYNSSEKEWGNAYEVYYVFMQVKKNKTISWIHKT